MKPVLVTLVVSIFCFWLSLAPSSLSREAEAGYYEGKTIKIVEGRRPGGTGSLRTTTTVRHLQKYLGHAAAVFQYLPGAGGTAGVNHMVNSARRDGLTIGNSSSGMFARAIIGARGVRYKLEDLVLLGAGSPGGVLALTIRPGLKIDSVEKLRAGKGFRFGNRSVGHSLYNADRLAAFVIGIKEPKTAHRRWSTPFKSIACGFQPSQF